MQSNDYESSFPRTAMKEPAEFAEPIPEYLRPGYRALMGGDAFTALLLWQAIYDRYPSAEICSHIARAHYYQTFFLGHGIDHPKHEEHIAEMRLWAERSLGLNPNSSIGHSMLAAALGRQSQLSGSMRQAIQLFWMVREHAERAILIDNAWTGHFVLGVWHREIASIHLGLRALAGLFRARLPDGTYKDSLRHFDEVLRQYPDNNTIYAEKAYTCERVGDIVRAREMYERALSMPLFAHPISSYLIEEARENYKRLLALG